MKIDSIKDAKFIDGKIGYIRLIEFQNNTIHDLDDALKNLESKGMDSLILDLRNNPGGVLEGAVGVSERFLPKDKVIVSIKARLPEDSAIFKSSGKFTHSNYPIIILVNEGSASAAEIVSGAVQDNRRGLIMGEKTYGKASVQTVVPMKDGSALRLTTAAYLTPSGRLIKNEGIMPDVVVKSEEVKSEKGEDIEDVFEEVKGNKPIKEAAPTKEAIEKDSQLNAAVNLMKAIKIYKQEKV